MNKIKSTTEFFRGLFYAFHFGEGGPLAVDEVSCHCEPVRTPVWQSPSLTGKKDSVGGILYTPERVTLCVLQFSNQLRSPLCQVFNITLFKYRIAVGVDSVHVIAKGFLMLQRRNSNGHRETGLV